MSIISRLFRKPAESDEKEIINAGTWKKVEVDTIAPCNGVYVFWCRGDNHMILEVYPLLEGERLWDYFEGENEHLNGWHIVKPEMYYFVPAPI